MNFVKSAFNVSSLAVRSINLHSKSVRFKSITTVKLTKTHNQHFARKYQSPEISQYCQRLVHSSPTHLNSVRSNAAALVIKKRPLRKKRSDELTADGRFNVYAYATADEYDLEALHTALTKQVNSNDINKLQIHGNVQS